MSSLKIVVTGAGGFIGSRVSEALTSKFSNASVIGIGRKKNLNIQSDFQNYEYISYDLLNGKLQNQLPGRSDIVIHLAGDRRSFVKPEEYSAQAISNIIMTSFVADYACATKARLLLYSSSVYVYSGNTETPFREDYVAIPNDTLGATKLASEALLKARAIKNQFKVIAFRIGTVYGYGTDPGQFLPQAIKKLKSKEAIARFGYGDVNRDFVFIDDVVEAFIAVISTLDRDFDFLALNVGSGVSTSIRDVVKTLAVLIGSRKPIEFNTDRNQRDKADTDHHLDITRIRSVLKWWPKNSLREGLRRTIEDIDKSQS